VTRRGVGQARARARGSVRRDQLSVGEERAERGVSPVG
jgi:hypothetical protein